MSRRLETFPARPLRDAEVDAIADADGVDLLLPGTGTYFGEDMEWLSLAIVGGDWYGAVAFDGEGWSWVFRERREGAEAAPLAREALDRAGWSPDAL